jgi:hypothetical protein
VVDQAGRRRAHGEAASQRLDSHVRVEVARDLPADDAPRVQVEDDREVHEAGDGAQVGQVRDPDLVRRRHLELALDQIRCDGVRVPRLRRGDEAAPRARVQTGLAHQARHALPTDAMPGSAQLGMDTRAAVATAAGREGGTDVGREGFVPTCAVRHRALSPGVVARRGDAERTAHERDGVDAHVGRNRRVHHDWFLAKYAAVFFRKSRSCSAVRSSRRSRTSSARSSVVSAPCGSFFSSTSACSTQVTPYRYLYDAPEVLRGAAPTLASDVFAATAVIAHMATGAHPFEGESAFMQMSAILGGHRRVYHGPPALEPLLARGLAADAAQRPTAGELAAAFAAAMPLPPG